MTDIVVNNLVTEFLYKVDKASMRRYENTLKKLDRHGDKMAAGLNRKLSRSFGKLGSNINRTLSRSLNNVERKAKRLGNIRANVKVTGAVVAMRQVEGVGRAAGRARKNLMSLKNMVIGGGSGYGAYRAGKKLFETMGSKQSVMADLTTATQSETQAKAAYAMIREFAEQTPFRKNDLAKGFADIRGMGYAMNMDELKALGDAAAGSGFKSFAPMIEIIKSGGRGMTAMIDNIRGMRAIQNGDFIDVQRYDSELGKWISKSVKKGDVGGIIKVIAEHSSKRFNGAMERMSKTLPGKMSTLLDRIDSRIEDFGAGGIEELMGKGMDRLLDLSSQAQPYVKMWGEWAGKTIPKVVEGAKGIGSALVKLKPLVKPVAIGLGIVATHMAGAKVLAGFSLASGLFAKMATFGGMAVRFLPALLTTIRTFGLGAVLMSGFSAAAAAALPILIGGAVAGLATLGWQLYKYWTEGDEALDSLRKKFPGLADAIKRLGDATAEWWPEIKKGWQWLKKTSEVIWTDLKPKAKNFFDHWFIPGLETTVNLLADMTEGFKLIYDFLKKITPTVADFLDKWTPLGWIKKGVEGLASSLGHITGSLSFGGGGGYSPAQGDVLQTALKFAAGKPGKSAADAWAKSNSFITGGNGRKLSVKQLYIDGVACDISAEKVLQDAGASKQVLDAMTGTVPDTLHNLVSRGLAEVVPYNQLKGGELFYSWSKKYNTWGHTGITGKNGQSIIHASNNNGKLIGLGQRFMETPNYYRGNAKYIRIKPQYMNQPGTQQLQARNGSSGITSAPSMKVEAPITIQVQTNASPQEIARQTSMALTSSLSRHNGLTVTQ